MYPVSNRRMTKIITLDMRLSFLRQFVMDVLSMMILLKNFYAKSLHRIA